MPDSNFDFDSHTPSSDQRALFQVANNPANVRRDIKLNIAAQVGEMLKRLFHAGVLTTEEVVAEINLVRADLGLAPRTQDEIQGAE